MAKSGAAGGNGMQSFSASMIANSEAFHEYSDGHLTHCSCGESYRLDPNHSFHDCVKLTIILDKGGCPYCNNKTPVVGPHYQALVNNELVNGKVIPHLEWYVQNSKKLLSLSFSLDDGKVISAIRIPNGFKPCSKTQIKAYKKLQEIEHSEKLEELK
jgi:hypothetical protein